MSSRVHWKEDWRWSIVFSDDSNFYLGASDGRMLVKRRPGERLKTSCLQS
ncbi:hypothetical protein AVEN_23856-1, partial [Araneus ventricosus]